MQIITSNKNQKVKIWKKLNTLKGRNEEGSYLIEGLHSVQEALTYYAPLQSIICVRKDILSSLYHIPSGTPIYQVTEEIAQHISKTNTPQGIFVETSIPNNSFSPNFIHNGKWLFLDRIQDPGNAGTLIRTADGAGFSGVLLSKKSVNPFGPKVVRSMQGSQFHLKIIYDANILQWIAALKNNDYDIYGTSLSKKDTVNYKKLVPKKSFVLVLGNESRGIDKEILSETTSNLHINLKGKAESLNVAIAGGILMFSLI